MKGNGEESQENRVCQNNIVYFNRDIDDDDFC